MVWTVWEDQSWDICLGITFLPGGSFPPTSPPHSASLFPFTQIIDQKVPVPGYPRYWGRAEETSSKPRPIL